jgi:lysophospholipase L1-like esterase
MKRLILAVCALALGCVATAQTVPSDGSTSPSTSTDLTSDDASETSSTTTPDNARYLKNPKLLLRCEAQLDSAREQACDIIFIGDSITTDWLTIGKPVWEKSYAPRHALDFGVRGDTTQNVLWRLGNMDLENLKPKVAVILIGASNARNSAHEIADGIKAVVANTQEVFSGVKIILVSLMPGERDNDKMMKVDSIIKSFADDSSVYYLDLVPLMPAVTTTEPDGTLDTGWKGLGKDHQHPDASGYQIWADAMEPLLSQLLK